MITLTNGQKLEFLAASGSLGFDGRGYIWERPWLWSGRLKPSQFTIVLKTLTFKERLGNWHWYNPHRVVKWLRYGGHVNSIGLTNPGFFKWLKLTAPKLNSQWNFIASITSTNIEEVKTMVQRLNNVPLVAVEFNSSCPNSPDHTDLLNNTVAVVKLAQVVSQYSNHPLILKLSCSQDYLEIVKQLAGGIQAVSINTVPWALAYPKQKSPLPKKFGAGGVSGKTAQAYTWPMVSNLVKQGLVPVIGASVWDYEDLEHLRRLGVGAVAFGSVFLRSPFYPCLPNDYIYRWRKEYGSF